MSEAYDLADDGLRAASFLLELAVDQALQAWGGNQDVFDRKMAALKDARNAVALARHARNSTK